MAFAVMQQAIKLHMSPFSLWVAYNSGGYLNDRYQGHSCMDWARYGIATCNAAVSVYTSEGLTETAALQHVASVDQDMLAYWS